MQMWSNKEMQIGTNEEMHRGTNKEMNMELHIVMQKLRDLKYTP